MSKKRCPTKAREECHEDSHKLIMRGRRRNEKERMRRREGEEKCAMGKTGLSLSLAVEEEARREELRFSSPSNATSAFLTFGWKDHLPQLLSISESLQKLNLQDLREKLIIN